MHRALTVLFFVVLLSTSLFAFAAEPEIIDAWRPRSVYRTQLQFLDILKPSHENPLHVWIHEDADASLGTHLRILYNSNKPIPVKYGNFGIFDVDVLASVLPAKSRGDVLLPLTISPGWKKSAQGYFVEFYGLEQDPLRVSSVQIENHSTIFSPLLAYARHPWHPQFFGISSINFHLGYRMGGQSLTLLLGFTLFALFFVLVKFSNKPPIMAFVLTCASVLLIHQARFLIDVSRAAINDHSEYLAQGTYKQVGDDYLVAERLREERPEEVTVCGEMLTLLSYFLYPIPTKGINDNWAHATHAALAPPWNEEDGIIHCRGQSRPGTVLEVFPNGGAAVRFTDTAS